MILKGWAKESKCFSFFRSSEDRPMPLSECPPCNKTGWENTWVMTLLEKYTSASKNTVVWCRCNSAGWMCSALYFFWTSYVFLWRSCGLVCMGVVWEQTSHLMHIICFTLICYFIKGFDAARTDLDVPEWIKSSIRGWNWHSCVNAIIPSVCSAKP